MIISEAKMQHHYETFVKCAFLNGKFSHETMRRAFQTVTIDMLRELKDETTKLAFAGANAVSNAELK